MDELKKALEAAKTEEEKLAVAREYEHELKTLSDKELNEVAAGISLVCPPGYHVKDNACWPN